MRIIGRSPLLAGITVLMNAVMYPMLVDIAQGGAACLCVASFRYRGGVCADEQKCHR